MAGLTCCVLWLGTVFTLSASDWRRREGEGARGTRDPPPPSPVVYFSYEISNVSYTSGWWVHGIILYQCKILHQLIHKVEQRCQVIHARRAEIRNFDPLAAPLLI